MKPSTFAALGSALHASMGDPAFWAVVRAEAAAKDPRAYYDDDAWTRIMAAADGAELPEFVHFALARQRERLAEDDILGRGPRDRWRSDQAERRASRDREAREGANRAARIAATKAR